MALAVGLIATPAAAQVASAEVADTASGPERAATGLEDIVVTARRRQESAQSAPLPVTAISGGQIEQLAVARLSGIAQLAPSLKVTQASGSANAPVVFIRGIGTIATTLYSEPSVGIYIDGAYTPRPQGNSLDLPDIERVEVLRGPQGTLFGRNTVGGAILLSTTTPSRDPSVRVQFGYGTNDESILSAVVQTGSIGGSSWRAKFAGQVHNRDGWVRTPGFQKSDWGGNQKDISLGFGLIGEVGDLTIDNRARYGKNTSFTAWQIVGGTPAAVTAYRNSAAANPSGPPLVIGTRPLDLSYRDPRVPGNADIENYGDTLTLTYEASDTFQIKSISAYSRLHETLVGQLGGSYILGRVLNPAIPGNTIEPVSVHSTPTNPGRQRQFSQELQFIGDVGDFSYVGGLYYWDEKVHENVTTILGSVVGANFVRVNRTVIYDQSTKSYAAFGQVAYKPQALDERLEITLGARYTQDKKSLTTGIVQTTTTTTRTNQAIADKYNNFGYSGTASYKFGDGILAYARIASSFRAGGFNAVSPGSPAYDPEEAITYEAGFKSDLFDRHLRLNANVYQIDYDDLQVNQYNSTTLTNFVVNAGKAKYRGFEVEGTALLGDHIQIDGNVGYVDPKYKEYILIQGGVPTNVASTAHFPYLSKWTTHVGIQYKTGETPIGVLTIRGDYQTKSNARLAVIDFLSPTLQNLRTGKEKDLSARVILSEIPVGNGVNLSAQVYGANLTNNRFITFATDFGTLATASFNRPRNYGLRITAAF
ncbi:TonB-dependent receptor [Sphingomonas jatrophae]|uniref:TonB-dependent receptor n=1 Tax=Sphingomonas jatrophae TaxID=1166337 RepID=UPI0013F4F20D|nr:TonB-dependent receptor [Sphingomonas jatrophae]